MNQKLYYIAYKFLKFMATNKNPFKTTEKLNRFIALLNQLTFSCSSVLLLFARQLDSMNRQISIFSKFIQPIFPQIDFNLETTLHELLVQISVEFLDIIIMSSNMFYSFPF